MRACIGLIFDETRVTFSAIAMALGAALFFILGILPINIYTVVLLMVIGVGFYMTYGRR